MKRLTVGQIEVPTAAITAAVALATSALTGIVTFTWGEARATADFRATISDHSREIERLRGLPVEDLKRLPARFEVFVAAAELQAKSVTRMEAMFAAGVRPASGKR